MHLSFSRPTTPPSILPPGITRTMISSPSGPLELLSATPSDLSKSKSPILFIHGGFGCAAVWRDFMLFLSRAPYNIPCYALSLRGHGNSWYPSYFRMVFMTGVRHLADDIEVGMRYIQSIEKDKGNNEQLVLVGHSAGGGLSQFLLHDRDVKLRGLVLAAAFPNFGGFPVYVNWVKRDPWFLLRMFWHLFHSKSPLSSTRLVKRIFFSEQMSDNKVHAFERLMAPYDSLLWPNQMMWRGFTNAKNVLCKLTGWGTGERLMVLGGAVDQIMTPNLMMKMANEYRESFRELFQHHKIDAKFDEVTEDEEDAELTLKNSGEGVRLCVVRDAGHHLQNDVPWEVGARMIAEFYEQL